MKAILLAAGFGTRLRPLTESIPKCLVQIKNKPLLEIWLETLTKSSINNFLINTHYLHEKVFAYINNSKYKEKCRIVYEKELLGTAGTLISNLNYIEDEDCLLIHADNYCLADFNAFIKKHNERPSYCVLTMMTFTTTTPKSCGIIETDSNGVVINLYEKVDSPPSNIANGAVYILSREFIQELKNSDNNYTDFVLEIIPKYLGRIYTYHTKSIFIDIGTPESYNEANNI